MKTKLRLTLDVEYELNGTDPEYLEGAMDSIVLHAVDEGLLTSYSEAQVEDYEYKVEVVGSEPTYERLFDLCCRAFRALDEEDFPQLRQDLQDAINGEEIK